MLLLAEFYVLLTCTASLGSAIRVDWNTNKGPIVPPTPPATERPQPPFRDPAPVWEPQTNDIPNPKSYVYVLPPPSRPRSATNNYLTSDRKPVSEGNYNNFSNYNNYGSLVTSSDADSHRPTTWNSVPSLAVKYVPNVGKKYYAVVPNAKQEDYYFARGGAGKPQGKYNAKTKKYKVYEKLKHVAPQPHYKQQGEGQQTPWFATQQLPVHDKAKQFNVTETTIEVQQQAKAKNDDRTTVSSEFLSSNSLLRNNKNASNNYKLNQKPPPVWRVEVPSSTEVNERFSV